MQNDVSHQLKRIEEKLDKVLSWLPIISQKENKIMALADDLKAAIKELDSETTLIASRIDGLVAKLAAGTLSDAEKADVMAAFKAESDRLKSLGTDPTNPVPAPPAALKAARKVQ